MSLSVCESTQMFKYLLIETHWSHRFTLLFANPLLFFFSSPVQWFGLVLLRAVEELLDCSFSLDDDLMVNSRATKATPSTLAVLQLPLPWSPLVPPSTSPNGSECSSKTVD